jgi:hypothetical protein
MVRLPGVRQNARTPSAASRQLQLLFQRLPSVFDAWPIFDEERIFDGEPLFDEEPNDHIIEYVDVFSSWYDVSCHGNGYVQSLQLERLCLAWGRQIPGETRLDLLQRNAAWFCTLVLPLVEQFPDALLLVVPNPVDVLPHIAWMLSSFPATGVIDTGTNLDSSRFRFLLAEHLDAIWQLPCRGTGYTSPSPRARYQTSPRRSSRTRCVGSCNVWFTLSMPL